MLKRILTKFICLFCFLFLTVPLISPGQQAVQEFSTNYYITYNIGPRGNAEVNHQISLKNNFSGIYPKSYQLELSGNNIQNIQAYDGEGDIISGINKNSERTLINLNFNEKSIGKDEELDFNIDYEIQQLAEKKGQVWNLNIPSLNNYKQVNDLQIKINTPKQFGTLAYSSIKPYKNENQTLVYLNNQLTGKGISLVFGEFQLFNFKLNYYLENSTSKPNKQEIPIPHNTNYQTVILNKLEPRPGTIISDQDNNWLAVYSLDPNENKDIIISGQAKIFAEPRKETNNNPDFDSYLKEDQYWPVNNPTFQKLADELNSVSEIYSFVVNHLDYNYETLGENNRIGAEKAYQTQSGVCTEFSDLFITLSRAKGIPARELEGFAFTDNKEIVSLSADNDVLHSWAEYWSEDKNQWIPVDPTWTKTTDGLDFMKSFDLGHFVFVTHGQSSVSPEPPGFYKTNSSQKNVDVSFANNILPSPEIIIEPKIEHNKDDSVLVIKNNSLAASGRQEIKFKNWSGNKDIQEKINDIPPLGEVGFKISPPPFWKRLFSTPKFKLSINGNSHELEWPENKNYSLKLQIKRIFANLLQK